MPVPISFNEPVADGGYSFPPIALKNLVLLSPAVTVELLPLIAVFVASCVTESILPKA